MLWSEFQTKTRQKKARQLGETFKIKKLNFQIHFLFGIFFSYFPRTLRFKRQTDLGIAHFIKPYRDLDHLRVYIEFYETGCMLQSENIMILGSEWGYEYKEVQGG